MHTKGRMEANRRKDRQNEGREVREENTMKVIQDKVNKKVKMKEYKGGKNRTEGKHLTVEKSKEQKEE